MAESKIEWTGRSDWNPIRGCTRVSPGCGGPGPHGGCYAEAMAGRFSDPGQWGHGFAERTSKGGRWTGLVAIQWDRLELPLRWRTPATIFASSTSDFFHSQLAMGDVAQLFGVMIAAHHLRDHIFQVLTKRPEIMRQWLNDPDFWEIANAAAGAHVMELVDPLERRSDDARATIDDYGPGNPPPGIWLGVSVEDQQRADERRTDFAAVPATVKFVSYEPALGPVDWSGWHFVQQIISGGESGPRARPTHPEWHRSTRDFCAPLGIAYFFKQWGEFAPGEIAGDYLAPEKPAKGYSLFDGRWHECWSEVEGHCDDEPDVYRIGKKAAGRLLDGVQHDGVPQVAA
jgi:protein gp37